MKIKLFELRDEGTCIPVMAIFYDSFTQYTNDQIPNWDARIKGIMARGGFYRGGPYVLLIKLNSLECQYDPYKWDSGRTMFESHWHIVKKWDSLEDGQVIDVRVLKNETESPAAPDCY